MPEPSFVDAAIMAAGAVVSWFVRGTQKVNEEQDRKIENLQAQIISLITTQGEVIKRPEFQSEMRALRSELNSNFQIMFTKLDGKADKS